MTMPASSCNGCAATTCCSGPRKRSRRKTTPPPAKVLAAAVARPEAASELASAEQCRYSLGVCHYQLEEFEKAGQAFRKAVVGLKLADKELAAKSAWMAFASFSQLAKDQPRYTASAIEMLELIKRDFPQHEYATKADYYINKLRQAGRSRSETIAELEKVSADSTAYLSARYDLCVLLHQDWLAARGKAGEAAAGRRVQQAVETYSAAATSETDQDTRLRSGLLAADVALNSGTPDAKGAADWLAKAAPLVEKLPPSDSSAAEFHYRSLQLSTLRDDDRGRREHADWLVQNASGSSFELPALIFSCKAVDAALESAAAPARPSFGRRVVSSISG